MYMKKLLLLAVTALIFMPLTKADAGYALFEQRKLLFEREMNNPERTEQEKRKLEEEFQKIKEAEEKMSGDKTPKFSGIG